MGLTLIDQGEAHYPALSSFTVRRPDKPGLGRQNWTLRQPRYAWSATIGHDPSGRGIPPPAAWQHWRVGIVQNVLRELMVVDFQSRRFEEEWEEAAVDYYDIRYAPFIIGPQQRRVHFGPLNRTFTFDVTAVQSLWYGPGGGLAPHRDGQGPPGRGPAPRSGRRGYSVEFIDAPYTPLRQSYGGRPLTRALHVLALQFWVLAIQPRTATEVVLAHSPPFTLVSGFEVRAPGGGRLPIVPPDPTWVSYSRRGIAVPSRDVTMDQLRQASQRGSSGALVPRRGGGGRSPVLRGETAIARAERWLRSHHLVAT